MNVRRLVVAGGDAILLVLLVAVAAVVAITALAPRSQNVDDRARAIEAQLRCPTCQGLSIADSPATSAVNMRSLVREQLAAGVTDEEVRAFFVARYGRWILLDPPVSGSDVLLWLAPPVVIAIGAVLVVRRARRAGAGRPQRRWRPASLSPMSRIASFVIAGAMILAVVLPIAAAVGPRLAGGEVTGDTAQKIEPSIADLEAFVAAEPRDVDALVTLGDRLLATNRAREAADRYRAALELAPDNMRALLGLGTILLSADRPDGAVLAFDRVLAISADQPDALISRAVALRRLEGRLSPSARQDVERFLDVAAADDPRREIAAALLAERPGASPTPATPRPS